MHESIPYESAKTMYLVDEIDNKEKLKEIVLDTMLKTTKKII